MSTETTLILYQRDACPYCHVVRKKLDSLGLRYLAIPVEKNAAEREELKKVSGQQSVPVLVDGSQVIVESSAILQHLDTAYGNETTRKMVSNNYGLRAKVRGNYQQVVEKTIDALKTQGFGVLTEIDVKQTLKKKLDVDVPQQVILGACNPNFAHQALEAEDDLGLLLPCNVVIRQADDSSFWVTAVDPLKLLSVVGRDDLLPVAAQVKSKMQEIIKIVAS